MRPAHELQYKDTLAIEMNTNSAVKFFCVVFSLLIILAAVSSAQYSDNDSSYSSSSSSGAGGRMMHKRSHSDTPTRLASEALSAESSSDTSMSNLPLRKTVTPGLVTSSDSGHSNISQMSPPRLSPPIPGNIYDHHDILMHRDNKEKPPVMYRMAEPTTRRPSLILRWGK
ncbi:hypothetical protein JTB14_019849 [Gonioctena quinquepunctata]|nr:hypothetical protein JTB14_019849 [Gonioctena quinquepunctata]